MIIDSPAHKIDSILYITHFIYYPPHNAREESIDFSTIIYINNKTPPNTLSHPSASVQIQTTSPHPTLYLHLPPSPPPPLTMLLQELLRLINLPCQIRAPPTVRMVQQHHLAMPLADTLLRHVPLTIHPHIHPPLATTTTTTTITHSPSKTKQGGGGGTNASCRIKRASRRFIFGSKPPL